MHFHYFTLQQLASALNTQFEGAVWESAFSQNKNELILSWDKGCFRIACNTPMTYFVIIDAFAKAGKNTASLFEEAQGLTFLRARVVPYERVLIIELSSDYELIIKLHRVHPNVMLRHAGVIQKVFNNKQTEDFSFSEISGTYNGTKIDTLDELETSDENVLRATLREISPIFDKYFAKRILFHAQQGISIQDGFLRTLSEANDNRFFVFKDKEEIIFSLFPPTEGFPTVSFIDNSPLNCIEALQFFLRAHYQLHGYKSTWQQLQKDLVSPYKHTENIYQTYQKSIAKMESERSAEEIGHILMANLHVISSDMEAIEVQDFYHENTNIRIKLKADISPQENATVYYKKHKERKAKIKHLQSELADLENRLLEGEIQIEAFEALYTPAALPLTDSGLEPQAFKALKALEKMRYTAATSQKEIPYRYFERGNWQIFVGKSAKNNDELLKFAGKDDIWLHAKDVSGSHAILRKRAGQEIPTDIIEYAAGLAAWFSKNRYQSLVPVSFTPRKYVRKRKGAAAGAVVVMQEEVVMVEPVKVD